MIELLYRYILRPELQNKDKELCLIAGILNNRAMMPSWLECAGCVDKLKSGFKSSNFATALKETLKM